MLPKLKISNFVLQRLEKNKTQCSGCLYGLMYQGTLIILGYNIETTNGSLKYKKIQDNFPTEIDLCGLIKFGLCTDAEAHLTEILQDIDVTDNPILLTCELGTIVGLKAFEFIHGKLKEVPFDIVSEDEILQNFYLARLQCDLQIVIEETSNLITSIQSSMLQLRKKLASGKICFNIKNTEIYLLASNSGCKITGLTPKSKMSDLFDATVVQKKFDDDGDIAVNVKTKKKTQQIQLTQHNTINVEMLIKKTKNRSDENLSMDCAIMTLDNMVGRKIEIPLHVDALSMLYKDTKSILLYDILVESICRCLRLMEVSLVDQVEKASNKEISVPSTYHFLPREFGHFFTCIYPTDVSDDMEFLLIKRKNLHNQFGLPMHKPFFRRSNCYVFEEKQTNGILVNTHIGLKQALPGGKQYLVQGKYSYHHYMQDNFNDDGWGCAYRSLQTLCSWFRWQGYSNAPIPTHRDIQSYLVKIGDKPQSFIGSRQWIGSTEVSMCLNGFMNVDSRIMYVRSGAELADKGAELAMHFESQGTPIMIGGGVLAHTILGIDYNNSTGELKFLILDPHYTGSEDLNVIQSKGWCGWKNVNFWDKKSYYNLCMPIRPAIY